MMGPSTKRGLAWRLVDKGEHVSIPCEGGFVPSSASEPGVEFQVEGQDGVFVTLSDLRYVIAGLEFNERQRAKAKGRNR